MHRGYGIVYTQCLNVCRHPFLCEEWRGKREAQLAGTLRRLPMKKRLSSQTTFAVLLYEHDRCFQVISAVPIWYPTRKCIPLYVSNDFIFVPDKRLPIILYKCDWIVFLIYIFHCDSSLIGNIEYCDHCEEVLIFALYDFCKLRYTIESVCKSMLTDTFFSHFFSCAYQSLRCIKRELLAWVLQIICDGCKRFHFLLII